MYHILHDNIRVPLAAVEAQRLSQFMTLPIIMCYQHCTTADLRIVQAAFEGCCCCWSMLGLQGIIVSSC